jgi:hypothetical protein
MNQVVKQCSDNYEMGGVKDGNLDSSSVLIHESHDEHAEILSKDETNNISKDENVMHVDIASRDKESSAAVQTRSQRERESKSLKPLKVTVIDALNIKPDEFRKLQETDAKLQKLWQLAVNPPVDPERVKHKFEVNGSIGMARTMNISISWWCLVHLNKRSYLMRMTVLYQVMDQLLLQQRNCRQYFIFWEHQANAKILLNLA